MLGDLETSVLSCDLSSDVGQPDAMNVERGRGRHRGRGRNSSGRNNSQRGGGRGIHRSNSDVQGANRFPPGLRFPDNQNQYSSSVPTASLGDLPEGSHQNGATDLRQAAMDAADRALGVPVRQQHQYRGNKDHRRNIGGDHATDNSPGLRHSHPGQNRPGAPDKGGSFDRRPSGARPAQSNVVAIPQRYVNSPNGTFHSPGSRQSLGTPDSRSRNGTAHTILHQACVVITQAVHVHALCSYLGIQHVISDCHKTVQTQPPHMLPDHTCAKLRVLTSAMDSAMHTVVLLCACIIDESLLHLQHPEAAAESWPNKGTCTLAPTAYPILDTISSIGTILQDKSSQP